MGGLKNFDDLEKIEAVLSRLARRFRSSHSKRMVNMYTFCVYSQGKSEPISYPGKSP